MRFLVLLAALLFATGAAAQTRLDDIIGREVPRIGLTGDYRPFSQRDKDSGAYSGLDVDMAAIDRAGVKVIVNPNGTNERLVAPACIRRTSFLSPTIRASSTNWPLAAPM